LLNSRSGSSSRTRGRASSPAAAGDSAAWRASCRKRPPHALSVRPNESGPRPGALSPVISNVAAGGGGDAAVASCPPASPAKRPERASQHDRPVPQRRHGSRAHPGRSAAGTGDRIRLEVTRRRQRRRPTRNPIQIVAGGAGVEAEAAARGRAVRRVQAVVRAVTRHQADAREARKWPE